MAAGTDVIETGPGTIGPTGRPVPAFPDPEPLLSHGPARLVAVCNQKGGVGKTTTTINLGAALAEQGRRVLLVDFDPQGALSVGLGIQPHELEYTVYNLLMERGVSAPDVVIKTNMAGMDLLPSNIDLSGAEVQLVHEVGREFVLGGVLEPVLPNYDIVLIDCQPSLGLLTVNALACSAGVLVPLECEYFAMRGVALLLETIDKVSSRLNPRLGIDGLLATMYDSRTLHSREVLAEVAPKSLVRLGCLNPVIGRRMRREHLGHRAGLLLFERLDLFEEVYERSRIVAGLVHILQPKHVGLGFKAARERQEADRDRNAGGLMNSVTGPASP